MTDQERVDVHVSLVNTNNRDLLRRCMNSLPAACAGLHWTVSVVDNMSTDGSAEMLQRHFPDTRLLQNTRRLGFSANHNQVLVPVVRDASARFVMVLNEDVELDPGSVGAMVNFCDEQPQVGECGPRIRGTDGVEQASGFVFPTVLGEFTQSIRPGRTPGLRSTGGWLNGSCLVIHVECLRNVGTLDERFFIFFEDTDLSLRLLQVGYQTAICPTAKVLHHGHQTVSQPALGSAMEKQMVRSRYLYFHKHHGRSRAWLVALLVRVALMARAAKAAGLAAIRRDAAERRKFRLLLGLASYNPAVPLPHESGS